MSRITTEILIIGAGAAGMYAALQLTKNFRVLLISKAGVQKTASWYAQGGIAAALDNDDSLQAHVADTLQAGAGLCDQAIVEMVVASAPSEIAKLTKLGVRFDAEHNTPSLTLEAGHSHKRIVHVLDHTGAAISDTLAKQVANHPNIHVVENFVAIDIVNAADFGCATTKIVGAYALDTDKGDIVTIEAQATILATGGASKAYLYANSIEGACGDGIAMAWRAGAVVSNLEFNQFHPTYLYHAHSHGLLLTEALRGEGAKLCLPNGQTFAHKFHPQAELAPRDIVARAIDFEMKRLGVDCVYLDIRHKPADWIRQRFPRIYQQCYQLGIDITKERIPVVPTAHYTCGGVLTNANGQTNLAGLYAIGETGCSGLHGANRLASNSLLECLVFATRTATHIRQNPLEPIGKRIPLWDASRVQHADEDVLLNHSWDELRRTMWNYVGIVRTNSRLLRAKSRLQAIRQEVHAYYAKHTISSDLIELRNLLQVSELMVESAIRRHESRGLHYTLDYPHLLNEALPSRLRAPL